MSTPSPRAQQRAERFRRESDLAKLEYQCEVLRGKWYAAMAALAKRGAHIDKHLTKEIKRWAATIRVLEERIERSATKPRPRPVHRPLPRGSALPTLFELRPGSIDGL